MARFSIVITSSHYIIHIIINQSQSILIESKVINVTLLHWPSFEKLVLERNTGNGISVDVCRVSFPSTVSDLLQHRCWTGLYFSRLGIINFIWGFICFLTTLCQRLGSMVVVIHHFVNPSRGASRTTSFPTIPVASGRESRWASGYSASVNSYRPVLRQVHLYSGNPCLCQTHYPIWSIPGLRLLALLATFFCRETDENPVTYFVIQRLGIPIIVLLVLLLSFSHHRYS